MTQQVMRKPSQSRSWKRGTAAVAVSLVLGATAACSDGGDSSDDPSPSDGASSSSTASESASDSTSPSATSTATDEPGKGGFAALPDCAEFATSIVKGKEVSEGDSTPGKTCRYFVGPEDEPVAVQLAFLVRGGGQWPEKFKGKELNTILSEAGEDDRDWVSKTTELKLGKKSDFTYGVKFHQTLGKAERTQYRLFTFSKNGDLLQCYTNAPEKSLDAFQDWCGEVLTAIKPSAS